MKIPAVIKSGIAVYSLLVLFGCRNDRPFVRHDPPGNPEYVANTAFTFKEDMSSPRFKKLRDEFQLDTIFHGETDEFKRMLLLRHWIRQKISISDFEETYPGNGYPDSILNAAIINGHGFHCGHYMIVQNAVMNAYGYVTRCLGSGPGMKGGPDWHHGINEIWSDTYKKWFLSDAKYDHHFEKNGIPLSALEVRDEYLKNQAADISLVKGPDRTVIEYDSLKNKYGKFYNKYKKDFAQAYTWIEFERLNDRFTNWPANGEERNTLNMYADDYFRNHTWIWDGKPHWAYHTKFMVPVSDRKAFEWTPNVVQPTISIKQKTASVELKSNTPNFATYQMRSQTDTAWKNVAEQFTLPLQNDSNLISFRTKNSAGVTGPEVVVGIDR